MGRKPGSKNIITKESLARIEKLVERHGSPTRAMFQSLQHWVGVRDAELAKTSRHRNGAKIDKATEWILKLGSALAPYTDKRQPTAIQSEVTQRMAVVKVPHVISNTDEWLLQHKPKHIDTRPVIERFSNTLRQTLDVADALNINDAGEILNQARKIDGNGHEPE
jgi:hypothetical protein